MRLCRLSDSKAQWHVTNNKRLTEDFNKLQGLGVDLGNEIKVHTFKCKILRQKLNKMIDISQK